MSKLIRNIFLTLSFAVFAATAMAQETANSDESIAAETPIAPDEEIIDEITVMGARELASLRAELIRADDAVYDLYNNLNDDDAYDVICKKETRIGSQIPRRVCLTRLYRDAYTEASVDLADGEAGATFRVNSGKHDAILREKMAALANAHPEFLEALKHRLELRKKFEREHAKKFD